MEYASFLAGDKWSDHPACTHPLLAELARQVNDFMSEDARQRLVELVPDLIGVTGADLRMDLRIALRVARIALPVVAEERQRMMAVAVLACERLLADLDGCPGAPLSRESGEALDLAPEAAAWARRYTRNAPISHRVFRRAAAPTIVRYAVQGVARACIQDPDSLLHDMLVEAIADCTKWCAPMAISPARPSNYDASPQQKDAAAAAPGHSDGVGNHLAGRARSRRINVGHDRAVGYPDGWLPVGSDRPGYCADPGRRGDK